MPLIEAFLALALTLLSLAMIATLIVELIHRFARTRSKNLKKMLEKFYETELKKMIENKLQKSGEKLEDKKKFIEKLVTNPLREEGKLSVFVKSHLKDPETYKKLTSLSTGDLFKGLAYTEIGKRIKTKTEAEIDEAVDSLSQSYEALGVAATDLFKQRAQIISLAVGILVAFVFNVNALLIFKSYLDDPQARAMAIAQADVALETYTKRTDNITGFQDKKELVNHVNSIRDEIKGLGNMGITIGYASDKVPISRPENPTFPRWLEIVFWTVCVLGTGFLIGLGGPFWFNVVNKLTDVLQVARGGAPTAAKPGDSAKAPPDPIKSNRDTFKMACEPPPLVKAQANLTAANKAVKTATDVLMGIKEAAGSHPTDKMKSAIENAEEALKTATDAQ
ncbi:MAG: hypothetical protein ACYSU4_20910, partial [Planctomycetota bacterium]